MKLSSWMITILIAVVAGNILIGTSEKLGWSRDLPGSARNIESFGNGWEAFELHVAGEDRHFLRQLRDGKNDLLVELRPSTKVSLPSNSACHLSMPIAMSTSECE